jgi:hypothetical protein
MTTFAGWLSEQTERRDPVGELARLWKEISPGRTHGLAGVTKALQAHADQNNVTWVPEAINATSEEFRAWKAHPETSSVHAPAVVSQLDRIEHMLRSLCDSLGIPLVAGVPDGEGAEVHDLVPGAAAAFGPDGELNTRFPVVPPQPNVTFEDGTVMVPYIKAEGGMGYRPVGQPPWAALYASADHNVPDGTEIEETG